jgi:hypothetical protein
MSKENNLTDFLTDVADAIREKKGTADKINPQNFSDEIKGIKTSSSIWTGHVDVEGLKAIGWDDEDISYYQEHGVNWMEEDDEYYKVSDDNKALYGVLTADNIQEYKDRIVWLPKIDTSAKTNFSNMFQGCSIMKGIPYIDTSKCTGSMMQLFQFCDSLTTIQPIDTSNATSLNSLFGSCDSLQYVPPIDAPKTTTSYAIFVSCVCLKKVQLNTLNSTSYSETFSSCASLVDAGTIHFNKNVTSVRVMFSPCRALVRIKLFGLNISIGFPQSSILSKQSILCMIENEAASEPITITLSAEVYARYANDTDVIQALANHPNVSLASA